MNWNVTYLDKSDRVLDTDTFYNMDENEAEINAMANMPNGCDAYTLIQKVD